MLQKLLNGGKLFKGGNEFDSKGRKLYEEILYIFWQFIGLIAEVKFLQLAAPSDGANF